MKNSNRYIHFGCGLIAPHGWENYDVSPTLRIQQLPVMGKWLAKRAQHFNFPANIIYGNIVKGLPVPDGAAQGVFCSHVLEHMTREQAMKALSNTFRMLGGNGIFRLVLPDLSVYTKRYHERLQQGDIEAADKFMREACLGREDHHDGWRAPIRDLFGNYQHKWMWDAYSLKDALKKTGFSSIRQCSYGDCTNPKFNEVERENRFVDALAFECVK